ncbi:MAG TPA: carboxypeptidase-like regulatory domain-containing protein, partial [Anaeromyxobacteraceae bacterium]|nr:carboxypeptidase-like regulatory domain-containing protein [Anaeromyxobacteraceae bacterium]
GVSTWADVAAGSLARVDLAVPETGTLEGLVSRRDRGPVGRATVTVLPAGSRVPAARVDVDARGRYRVQLPAGEYAAFAAPGDGADAAPRERPAPVRVAPGNGTQLDLVLSAGPGTPSVVRVVEQEGVASAGTLVLVTTTDDLHAVATAVTDDEGLVRVEVDARGPLHARAVRGGRVGGPVPLAPSGPTVVTLRAPAQLRGTVVALDGPPAGGFTLELVALSEDASVATTLGGAAGRKSAHGVEAPRRLDFADERFEIPDAPAGPVRLMVQTTSGRSGVAEAVLTPGGVHEVQVVLDPGASVEGRAVDARTRRPVVGASVLVGDGRPARAQARTDADGSFRLSGLPSGPRLVRVLAPGYAPAERYAQLEPSADIDVGEVALVSSAAASSARSRDTR